MADETSAPNSPGFPESLETCLREDACVRADAGQLQLKLEEARAAAAQAREGTALPGRLLAALGRRKGPSTPEEAAEIFARENILQRQSQESARLRQSCAAKLDAHLAAYLRTVVPVVAQQGRARERLGEWERLITELRVDLRELIKALGQARNQAVAAYDRNASQMCATARELLAQAGGLIRTVDAGVARANAKATEIGGLPGITIIPLQATVNSLTQQGMGATLLADFDRLVRELESFEQRQLVDLEAQAVAAADAQVAQAQAYVAQYREQLRAHYATQVTPEETAEAIPGIIERFRRGM